MRGAERCASALTGRPPFEGDDALAILQAHLQDPVPEPTLESSAGREVYSLVRGLLAQEPADREDAVRALRGEGAAAGSAPSGPGRSSGTWAGRVGAAVGRAGRWLRERPSRFWVVAGASSPVLTALLVRDPASAACREVLPDPGDDGRAVIVEPLGTVEQGSEIEVAFTACGLSNGESFDTRLTIRPADGGGAGELEAGPYRLIVEAEDGSGRETEADREFTVVER